MKKFLVVFLALAMIFSFAATAMAEDVEIADYTDMADQKAEWQVAVYRLTALGVLEGNTGIGGDFRPGDYMTRAELAKVVIYLTGNTDKVEYYASQLPAFKDVADGFWAEGYINACADLGLMKGVGYGMFAPNGTVTFQETATVVLRALGYTDALKGDWPNDYSRKAGEVGIIEYVDYIGPKAITRVELASIFNEALDKLMVSYIADATAQGIGQIIGLSAWQMDWYDVDESTIGVDADGFAYNIFYTNEKINHRTNNKDLLNFAFGASAGKVQFIDDAEFTEAMAWGYDDFDDVELLIASIPASFFGKTGSAAFGTDDIVEDEIASLYYIYGAELFSLANHQANLTYNDDDEVVFVEITSQAIKVDSWKDTDYAEFDDANGKKLTVGDDKYEVNIKKGLQLNNDKLYDTVNAVGGFGYLFVDSKDNAYDYKEYYQFADADHKVFDNVDDNYVNMVDGYSLRINKLDDYVIIKDGEFIELDDLEFGDVLYMAGLLSQGDDVNVYVAIGNEVGDMSKGYYGDSSFGFLMDDVRYYGYDYSSGAAATAKYSYYSVDGGESFKFYPCNDAIREEFFDEEVTYAAAYAWRNFVYVAIDVEAYQYGVIKDLDYRGASEHYNILTGVDIYMADGTTQSYQFDKDFWNSYVNGEDSNERIWTKGSLVEFTLNKDGEIITMNADGAPEMWFGYDGEVPFGVNANAAQGYGIDTWFPGETANKRFVSRTNFWTVAMLGQGDAYGDANYLVEVDKDDATIFFDNETYNLPSDAEIFLVTASLYTNDDPSLVKSSVKMISAEDLLADEDFSCWQIAAFYTSGIYGTTVDTLWIVNRDIADDIEMGYENGGKEYDGGTNWYVKIDDAAGTPASKTVHDNWGSDFSLCALSGDEIDSVYPIITFSAGVPAIVNSIDAAYGEEVASTDPITSFKKKGSSTVYNITVGFVEGPADVYNRQLKLAEVAPGGAPAPIYNPGNSFTYGYQDATFFKDLGGGLSVTYNQQTFDLPKRDDIEDLEAGDMVLIVRKSATITHIFRIAGFDFPQS